jgi:DNA-binding transcriptional LysR family regulator
VLPIRRNRLVACLRADHALAAKAALQPADLQGNLAVLHHPQRYPTAHARLLELLAEAGVQIGEFSRVSHPAEAQALVKAGYGLALIREGTILDTELTTRPVAGVDWAVETAFVYNKQRHPETIAVLARHLKRRFATPSLTRCFPEATSPPVKTNPGTKRPPRSEDGEQGKYPIRPPRMKIAG